MGCGRFLAWVAVLAGCAQSRAPAEKAPAGDDGVHAEPAPAPADEPEPPPYGPEVVSLRLRRSIVVRFEPRQDAKEIGTVAQDTRVAWKSAARGPGCEGKWIEIQPRGWVCDRYLEPTTKAPA